MILKQTQLKKPINKKMFNVKLADVMNDRGLKTPMTNDYFATGVGEPNNGAIRYCPLVTSKLAEVDPPLNISGIQMCNSFNRYLCVKEIAGKHHF
jgi:hypothetical protein